MGPTCMQLPLESLHDAADRVRYLGPVQPVALLVKGLSAVSQRAVLLALPRLMDTTKTEREQGRSSDLQVVPAARPRAEARLLR